jgi:hypothetical protein
LNEELSSSSTKKGVARDSFYCRLLRRSSGTNLVG